MKQSSFPLRLFWSTEAGLTGVLVFLILFLAASFLMDRYHITEILYLVFLSLFFISGALSVSQRPTGRLVFGGLALAALGFLWIDYLFPAAGIRTERILVGMLAVSYLILLLLRQVFSEGAITYHRICGAVAVYLLVALVFSDLCMLALRFNPEAFQLPPELLSGSFEGLQGRMFYFSIVTLTTLGYGDIVPVSAEARLAAMLEALIGQLYPAILLAWLVSMEIVSRSRQG